jgi:carbamoyltransferase
VEDVYKLIEVDRDGGFRLNMEYFTFHHSTSRTFGDRFVQVFGPPRRPESDFYTLTTHPAKNLPNWDHAAAAVSQEYANIAASIQYVTEETMLKMAKYAHEKTGLKKLVMAGGVALNSVANGRSSTAFEEIYIQLAAGDDGGAVGGAIYHVILGKPKFVMERAYGARLTPRRGQVRQAASGYRYERVEDPEGWPAGWWTICWAARSFCCSRPPNGARARSATARSWPTRASPR